MQPHRLFLLITPGQKKLERETLFDWFELGGLVTVNITGFESYFPVHICNEYM